ncbi:MAG: hypothetical protein ACFFER_18215 [Candidatus Thorarchaeota archaeon]
MIDRAMGFLSFNDWLAKKEYESHDWIVVARFTDSDNSDFRTFSCLASIENDSLKTLLSTEDWDILFLGNPLRFGWPEIMQDSNGKLHYNSGQSAIINGIEFKPFTIYHQGEDYTIHHFELVQNFLLFADAYYDSSRKRYVSYNEDKGVVAKCEEDGGRIVSISVNAHLLKQYLAANRSYLVRYHDHRRWAREDISSHIGEYKKLPIEIDLGVFELLLQRDVVWKDKKSNSRLLGKDVIPPYTDNEFTYVDCVYGEAKKETSKSSFFEALKIIQAIGKNMERQAASFHKMNETQLRDVILTGLNTHNLGYATGEAFSVGGRTDIFIPFGNGHPFITECKIWDGASKYKEAISQLFNYLKVQDEEGVIITFFRGQEFSSTVERAIEAIKSDASYIQESWMTNELNASYGTAYHKHPRDSKKQVRLHHLFIALA